MNQTPRTPTALSMVASIPWCCVLPATMSLLSLTGAVAARTWLVGINWLLFPLSLALLGRALWLAEVRRQGRPLTRWVTRVAAVLVLVLWAPRIWAWVVF